MELEKLTHTVEEAEEFLDTIYALAEGETGSGMSRQPSPEKSASAREHWRLLRENWRRPN
jgi:hypothetical protein